MNLGEAEYILSLYGIREAQVMILCIESIGEGDGCRCIYHIETTGSHLVCHISGVRDCPRWLIENQSRFSDLLFKNGVQVAKKLMCASGFCTNITLNGVEYCASLEHYLGEDLVDANIKTFETLGRLIGKMHRISQKNSAKIGFSYVSAALCSGRASFSRVLEKAEPALPNCITIRQLEVMHDGLVSELLHWWKILPVGAVHGDLGIFNNLMKTENGLGIIDFNRSGDEVFLGDMLAAFYASVHKLSWQKRLSDIPVDRALHTFFSGYNIERPLVESERECYPLVAAMFDGLFYCKKAIELWNSGDQARAWGHIQCAQSHFVPDFHPIPQINSER